MFQKTIGYRVFIAVSLLLIGSFVFLPLLWMLNTALKPAEETFTLGFFNSFTWNNFENIIQDLRIRRYLLNSLLVSLASSFFSTVVSALTGYSFSKFRYKGRKAMMAAVMMAQTLPSAVLLLTIYLMMQRMNLLDHYLSLVLSYVTFTLPVGAWTLKNYFDQISNSLIEAAKVDGAGQCTILGRVVLPLAVPGIISVAIYGFVWSWNDLLYSLTLVTAADKRTLAPGLVLTYMGEFTNNWGNMMAASVVVSIPVTLMFLLLQKYFIQGITGGAVKE